MRRFRIERRTEETAVEVELEIDGRGQYALATGLPFFDHLLSAFARHGLFDLTVTARGDLEVEAHHTVEDVGLALGEAFRGAVGAAEGVRRWGWALVPMDETLAQVAVDLSGRPFLSYRVPMVPRAFGLFHTELGEEFWRAFVRGAAITLHCRLLQGRNAHHVLEAVWKGAGLALREAVQPDPRIIGPLSTKGNLGRE